MGREIGRRGKVGRRWGEGGREAGREGEGEGKEKQRAFLGGSKVSSDLTVKKRRHSIYREHILPAPQGEQ